MVDALVACVGNVQFIVLPDSDHDISELVYTNLELYAWLLSHVSE